MTLSDELRQRGADITFICRPLPGSMEWLIKKKGFKTLNIYYEGPFHSLQDAKSTHQLISEGDLLIIDHYDIDVLWEEYLRSKVKKILVIDDDINKSHDCDYFLNYHFLNKQQMNENVPKHCEQWLGKDYVILKKEFLQVRKQVNRSLSEVKRVLISFGGSDPTNDTSRMLKLLSHYSQVAFDVVIGHNYPNISVIKNYCEVYPQFNVIYNTNQMANLILKADLAIGSAGISSYERCYLGLPTITIQTATNQSELIHSLASISLIEFVGESQTLDEEQFLNTFNVYLQKPIKVNEMSDKCLKTFENIDGATRVATKLMEGLK